MRALWIAVLTLGACESLLQRGDGGRQSDFAPCDAQAAGDRAGNGGDATSLDRSFLADRCIEAGPTGLDAAPAAEAGKTLDVGGVTPDSGPLASTCNPAALPVNVSVPKDYSTIAGAITAVLAKYAPGGTLSQGVAIHVDPGNYSGFKVPATFNGTASAPLRIISDTRWGAKIDGQIMIGGGKPRKGDYVEIVGFDVTGNVNDGIWTYGAYNKILCNHVHDLLVPSGCMTGVGGAGITVHYILDTSKGYNDYATYSGHDTLVKGNVVERIGPPFSRPFTASDIQQQYCHFVHGIYPSTWGNTIVHNVVNGSPGWGIHAYHFVYKNNISYNTLINHRNGGIVNGADSGAVTQAVLNDPANASIMSFNIAAYNLGQPAIEDRWGIYSPHDKVWNNLYYDNAGGDYFYSTNGDIKDNACSIGSGLGTESQGCRYVGDPMFVSVAKGTGASGDYHLESTSPYFGKGLGASEY